MGRRLSLALYNALLPPALLAMLPGALVKMQRRGGRWQDLGQRLACFDAERTAALAMLPKQGRVWMHAVSVGEVMVAQKVINELRRVEPERGIVLSCTTPTGHRLAMELEARHPGRVVIIYSPLDLRSIARRLFDQIHPAMLVLVEAEVWPNIVSEASAREVPVWLINARLSPRSERRYLSAKGLVSPIFQMLDRVCVQEPDDATRWQGLGVAVDRITLTGSIKYDPQGAAPSSEQVAELGSYLEGAGLGGRPLIVAASTFPGEEVAFARAFMELRERHPELGLLLVPRHFERGNEVLAQVRALGLSVALRSAAPQGCDVVVVDTTGELRAWQEHATMVVIGKSFLAEGGQNPAEAVMAGKPVITGPHMQNFAPLMALLHRAGGVVALSGLEDLVPALERLLSDSGLAKRMAEAGRRALEQHSGATHRTVTQIAESLASDRNRH